MEIEGYDFINTKCRICCYIGCNKEPGYGYINTTLRLCCSPHKLENMIYLHKAHKKCKCGQSQPIYGLTDDEKPTCCSKCRENDMVDILSKRCKCGLHRPSFGLIDDESPSCCSECKTINMVNIKSSKCKCGKSQPTYGLIDDEKPTCCAKCRENNMTNIRSTRCKCGLHFPTYGFIDDEKPTCCLKCKNNEMINIKSKKCLCGSFIATFGYLSDRKRICCSKCRQNDMVCLPHSHKKCKSELCNTESWNVIYDGYCSPCFRKLFPNHEFTKIYKVKEKCIVDFIDQYFKEYKPVYDKRIKGGSSFRRPDIYIDCITHIVIIEIDEDQHRGYDSDNETYRSMQLLEDVSNRFTIFIRFNPDNYIDKDGNKIESCFEYSKVQKKLIISNQDALNNRLNTLRNCIEKHIKNTPDKAIQIVNLYYDGF